MPFWDRVMELLGRPDVTKEQRVLAEAGCFQGLTEDLKWRTDIYPSAYERLGKAGSSAMVVDSFFPPQFLADCTRMPSRSPQNSEIFHTAIEFTGGPRQSVLSMESDSSSCLRYHPPPVYLIYCSEEFLDYEYGCRATYHVRRCCDVPPHGAVLTLASVMEHICRLALPAIDEPHPHRTSPVSQYEQDLTRAGSQKSQIHSYPHAPLTSAPLLQRLAFSGHIVQWPGTLTSSTSSFSADQPSMSQKTQIQIFYACVKEASALEDVLFTCHSISEDLSSESFEFPTIKRISLYGTFFNESIVESLFHRGDLRSTYVDSLRELRIYYPSAEYLPSICTFIRAAPSSWKSFDIRFRYGAYTPGSWSRWPAHPTLPLTMSTLHVEMKCDLYCDWHIRVMRWLVHSISGATDPVRLETLTLTIIPPYNHEGEHENWEDEDWAVQWSSLDQALARPEMSSFRLLKVAFRLHPTDFSPWRGPYSREWVKGKLPLLEENDMLEVDIIENHIL
ncbi:uncharacterized protein BT62DRAFT_1010712 [Guyanagaster necrorhizus]|uniref:Uncharacterized protein n=1 Tax=Guyanagaster necrorhizus TaxID=856835 RepID=A0A9P8ANW6_9AGAR|nr:uncharacterized protein BT62DRAFT_1010712 [Guyanagaster necrorhizus MCA 3950]KAG7442176.1 hypothetical protein BT62DRAFT_1010712 [Guyanagaster necrorhizus MCA 3950]